MSAVRAAVALAAALLGACAATPPRAPLPARDERAVRAVLTSWQATGRLGVQAAQSGFSAGFEWAESPAGSTIDVHGPLGVGAVHITRTAQLIVIDNGHGPAQQVPAPFAELEEAMSARLGAPLPLAALRYWLLGLPDPGSPAVRDADNRFVQDGWQVTAGDPQQVAGAPGPLPRQLVLERGPTRIKVVVTRWRVAAGPDPDPDPDPAAP